MRGDSSRNRGLLPAHSPGAEWLCIRTCSAHHLELVGTSRTGLVSSSTFTCWACQLRGCPWGQCSSHGDISSHPPSQSRDTSLSCVLLLLTTKFENGFHLVLFILVDADHCLPCIPVEPTSATLDSVQHGWMSFTKAPGDSFHCWWFLSDLLDTLTCYCNADCTVSSSWGLQESRQSK